MRRLIPIENQNTFKFNIKGFYFDHDIRDRGIEFKGH